MDGVGDVAVVELFGFSPATATATAGVLVCFLFDKIVILV